MSTKQIDKKTNVTSCDTPLVYDQDMEITLCKASLYGDIKQVKNALKRGAINYDVALANAALNNHIEIAKLLVNKAFNKEWALSCAASQNNKEMVKLILEDDFVDIKNAVYESAVKKHMDMVEFLVQAREGYLSKLQR